MGDNSIIGKRMENDREFCLRIVECYGDNLEYAGDFDKDSKITYVAVKNYPKAIRWADDILLNDRDWMLKILQMDKRLCMWVRV